MIPAVRVGGTVAFDWRRFWLDAWRRLPADVRRRAVEVVRSRLDPDTESLLCDAVTDDPQSWWVIYHHGFGTAVRNSLRLAGMKDDALPPRVSDAPPNWDDYYVAVVEVALRRGIYEDLGDEERA